MEGIEFDRFFFSRLVIAVPELYFDVDFLDLAARRGYITPAEFSAIDTGLRAAGFAQREVPRLRDGNLIARLMSISPELVAVESIDFLRRANLISVSTAQALRLGLRGASVLSISSLSDVTIGNRMQRLFGIAISRDTVNLIRSVDDARINALRLALLERNGGLRLSRAEALYIRELLAQSVERAQQLRSGIAIGRLAKETVEGARAANTVWGALTVVLDNLLSDRLLKNAIRAGAISPQYYDLIRSLELLGLDAWRKGLAAYQYESWAARALMMSEGILSPLMVNVLVEAGLISPELARYLRPATTLIRGITRTALTQYMTSRRYRVTPGEPPLRTYLRASQASDRAVLRLLADAAADSRREIEALSRKPGFARQTRTAQQRLVTNALNQQMRILWEGVGYLTIFGERETARAAIESSNWLQRRLFKGDNVGIQRMLDAQARAGVDSYISRQENILQLSDRVYKNTELSQGVVQREVQKGLLRGLNARQLALNVARTISPTTPGGVSYAALRLARTELNNAFHFSQIRYTREMPWVRGYQWHLSGSHPTPDQCNIYEAEDHDGLGRGVFKKSTVPGKPHPNCLCFLTTVTANPGEFEAQLRRGSYDQYLRSVNQDGIFAAESNAAKATTVRDGAQDWAATAGRSLAAALLTGAGVSVARGLRSSDA